MVLAVVVHDAFNCSYRFDVCLLDFVLDQCIYTLIRICFISIT